MMVDWGKQFRVSLVREKRYNGGFKLMLEKWKLVREYEIERTKRP